MNDRIYLDHAATSPIFPEVLETMTRVYRECWGNPASIHGTGREAQKACESARRTLAALIGAEPKDVFFTSGGSESDNHAIKGCALANRDRGNHIITTFIEHHAVLRACGYLEKLGFDVTYLPVDREGFVRPEDVEKAITDRTILVSVMMANNEIGTLEPIRRIAEISHRHGAIFHTDAVQAAGILPVSVADTGADLISLSAHKFHGPRGVGALYIRQGTRVDSLIHGGDQQRRRRAGTENVAAAAGMAQALALCTERMEEDRRRITALRDRLIDGILSHIPEARLNGPRFQRLPGNCHFSFPGIAGEALLLRLDLAGIAASGGSACTSGSVEPSHVLMAIGQTEREAASGIRLTVGRDNTESEIDETVETLASLTADMRQRGG